MKLAISLFLLAAGARLAAAQPAGPDPTTAPEAPAPPPPPPVIAPAPIPPTALPIANGERPHEWRHDDDEPVRPHGFAVGIGLGYDLPTSLEVPNVTSVRLRFGSGLTLEPFVTLANTAAKVDTGMPETTNTSELGVGATVRYPIVRHRKVDLEVVARLSLDQSTQDPPGDENSTTTTNVDLGYGLAVAYWFTPHWNLSLTAANPILDIAKTHLDEGPATTVNTTTTIGLIWNPTVAVMVHLYN